MIDGCQNKREVNNHALLGLAAQIAGLWIRASIHNLSNIDKTDLDARRNALSRLADFDPLETYARDRLPPDIDTDREEQFILSLEKHWRCELNEIENQLRIGTLLAQGEQLH